MRLSSFAGHNLTDCHCHILPEMDDGALSERMAIEMARVAIDNGTSTIVCTPHHLNGLHDNPREKILDAVAQFEKTLERVGVELTLVPGSELHLTPETNARVAQGNAMTMADKGQAVLIELPPGALAPGTEQYMDQLLYTGITPIVAHPERNPTLAGRPELVLEWFNAGVKLQLTAASCAGKLGEPVQRLCQQWLEAGYVHLLASDGHRPDDRSPNMRNGIEAVEDWIGSAFVDILITRNPANLIDGKPLSNIPVTPAPRKSDRGRRKKKFFTGLFKP